mmetsp:Transcript_73402/g.185103  ORF Transcript_73402/g.185103 Transcript_73402/m.185103 type:complete len:202 (-) Transcript_73402:245-850(-)
MRRRFLSESAAPPATRARPLPAFASASAFAFAPAPAPASACAFFPLVAAPLPLPIAALRAAGAVASFTAATTTASAILVSALSIRCSAVGRSRRTPSCHGLLDGLFLLSAEEVEVREHQRLQGLLGRSLARPEGGISEDLVQRLHLQLPQASLHQAHLQPVQPRLDAHAQHVRGICRHQLDLGLGLAARLVLPPRGDLRGH